MVIPDSGLLFLGHPVYLAFCVLLYCVLIVHVCFLASFLEQINADDEMIIISVVTQNAAMTIGKWS